MRSGSGNARALGRVLYTQYAPGFEIVGVILPVAIELILLAVNINTVAFPHFPGAPAGHCAAAFPARLALGKACG